MDCLFCEIAKGNIPSTKIYEDDDVIGFLDINPTSLGHALFIPKKHSDNVTDCQNPQPVFDAAIRYGKKVQEKLGAQGFNLLSNCGEQAGQTIHHFHVHIIPRFDDPSKDQLIYGHGSIETPDFKELQALLS